MEKHAFGIFSARVLQKFYFCNTSSFPEEVDFNEPKTYIWQRIDQHTVHSVWPRQDTFDMYNTLV